MDWKQEALKLKLEENKSWHDITTYITAKYPKEFAGISYNTAKDRIRGFIRNTEEYKDLHKNNSDLPDKSSMQYNADGSIVSEKFITLKRGEEMTPLFILEAHGLNPDLWEVKSYKNNFWNTQLKGGTLQISYQSKLEAKPLKDEITTKDFDRYFENKQFKYDKPLTTPINYDADGEILEVDLPDLHKGLLAWRMETGKDYDINIARDYFYKCIYDIINRCVTRKFKKIIFVTLGDLLHIDNDKQETTKGTFQQADGRTGKIFDATLDMLIDVITLFANIAPVEMIYVSGNHDRVLGYGIAKAVQMAFRNDENVTVDTTPDPQKYREIGVSLVGFTHGDMPVKNIGGWLQNRAREAFGRTKFTEVHSGHFHTDRTREYLQTDEQHGVVVRCLPVICNSSYWEYQQGYVKSRQAIMCFVWNEQTGLREMWYSSIN